MEKIKLKSDFRDYYDHWFDNDGRIFERYSTGGFNRREMLVYLKSLGIQTPLFGTVTELYSAIVSPDRGNKRVLHEIAAANEAVVYLDPMAHRGEGKVKLSLAEAIEQYPGHFATEFIPRLHGKTRSFRHLQVGHFGFYLIYTSDDKWRSNCGSQIDIEVLMELVGYHPKIQAPLFAIDFVAGDKMYAVDFNISPQVRQTGVEDILTPREAAEAIKRAINAFGMIN